jgi:hypothetical protein
MDIVKKNFVSILCGVIAIVAVVCAFFPMSGYFDDLHKKLEERKGQLEKANQVAKKPRQLPDVDLVSTADPVPLSVFPSQRITGLVQRYMEQLISQSLGVLEAAVKINRAECVVGKGNQLLLVDRSLPEPAPNTDNIFKRSLTPEADRVRNEILGAGYPPKPEDIARESEVVKLRQEEKRKKGADGQAINEEAVQKAIADEVAALPEKMRLEASTKARIYVDPDVISASREVVNAVNGQSPTPSMIWYAQASMWLQEDVCRAIAAANKSSRNVQEAPVKRIVALTIPFGPSMYVRGPSTAVDTGTSSAETGGRVGVSSGLDSGGAPANEDPKRAFTVSPTGRSSNSMYDVIAFNLELHVDQTKLPSILKALSQDRFITVRSMSVSRVDPAQLIEAGFVYGSAPIVDVSIDAEAIQLREWTVPLMPRAIKDMMLGPGVEYQSALKPEKKVTSAN